MELMISFISGFALAYFIVGSSVKREIVTHIEAFKAGFEAKNGYSPFLNDDKEDEESLQHEVEMMMDAQGEPFVEDEEEPEPKYYERWS